MDGHVSLEHTIARVTLTSTRAVLYVSRSAKT